VLRSLGSTERVSPLAGSDSSFEDAPADLPLRDDLFAAAGPRLEPAPRHSGLRLWMIAAAALVVGILIGFASGFSAGQRVTGPDLSATAPSAPSGESTASGQTFSEAAVREPVRVDADPIVPQSAPVAVPAPAPAPGPARSPRAASAAGRAAPPPVETVAPGPGSIQVLSRPSGAQVLLDGRSVGRTPLAIADVRTGAHDVRLELPGFRRWATSVEVKPGERARVAASLEQ
jgi:hypothetical protein